MRLHVEAGGWVLRGAAAGGQLLWRRGDEEHSARADGFTGSSPAHLVVTSRLARPRVRLVAVTDPVLATREVLQAWSPRGPEQRDGVDLAGFDVSDLATGEGGAVHLTGDVVVDAPGVRLLALTLP